MYSVIPQLDCGNTVEKRRGICLPAESPPYSLIGTLRGREREGDGRETFCIMVIFQYQVRVASVRSSGRANYY
jgi:hypothetical protein